MNIVLFGPGMQNRTLVRYALQPVQRLDLTPLEVLVRRVSIEVYHQQTTTIIGVPWVNPRGRGSATAMIEDYLNNPVSLYRALEVAFLAPRSSYHAEGAIIAADVRCRGQFESTQQWVMQRLSTSAIDRRILWWLFDPSLDLLFTEGTRHPTEAELRDLIENHLLPSVIPSVNHFCQGLNCIFQ